MQRSAAAVSVEVKQVIAALCRLLAATGLECVPAPEHFRRAKFGGGPAVEDQFWQLLANIQQKCGFVSCEPRSQLGGELRRLVAAGLWQTGYHADWIKDLLLALGWLLATGTLEKLLTQRVEQLDKTLILTPSPVNHRLSTELPLDSASVRRLQWLVGSLRHQGRTLLSMQEERTCLLHAVSVASLPSSVSPSSTDQSSTLLRKKGQGRVREAPEGRGEGGLLQGRSDSCLPPLSCPPRLPCCPLAYRLQTERPVRHSSPPADGDQGGTPTAGGLSASQAVELLLQTEALLLERRGRQRLANRTQLQEMIGRLDELVLIPP
ncbi:hypothetical protein KUCAC02_025487 [Chaenocephalus aceratus]|uniref:Uncharacterized protein n=1 Tax=Chaenocephalus aceratus TaxID=36190 RepID=A0ACB9VU32_CHAAC|nr:hypothetical protein KUCAC02_025487 [Chaenocephalus aceratus]